MTSRSEHALHEPQPAAQSVDRLGALASTACAVHCVLSATLPGVFAALGLAALLGHESEWAFTLVALAFAAVALILGFRKHRSLSVTFLLGFGMTLLLLARVLEDAAGETVGVSLSIAAGVLLVGGHLSNIRVSRRARLTNA